MCVKLGLRASRRGNIIYLFILEWKRGGWTLERVGKSERKFD